MIGTALFLTAVAIPLAARSREERENDITPIELAAQAELPSSYLVFQDFPHEYFGDEMRVTAIVSVGPRPPVPPGLTHVPATGEMAVSPALADLLSSERGTLLRSRLDARVTARIEPDGLESPDSLVGYVGVPSSAMVDGRVAVGFGPNLTKLSPFARIGVVAVSAVLILGILVPIGSLVASSARLSARRRELCLAAYRLAGAPTRVVRLSSGIEMTILATLGALLGVFCYLAARPLVVRLLPEPFRWFPDDLALPSPVLALCVLGVASFSLWVSMLSLRRVVLTPLGVVRNAKRRATKPAWLGVLCAGLVLLALSSVLAGLGRDRVARSMLPVGMFVTVVSIVPALPWLNERVARHLARWSRRPWAILGTHTVAANPGTLGRAAGAVAVVVMLGGAGQAFLLASAPSTDTVALHRAEAEPNTVFISTRHPQIHVISYIGQVEGVTSVERRPTDLVGGTGLKYFAARTDGSEVTEERIKNALALKAGFVAVESARDARRSWLGPWSRYRRAMEMAVAFALVVVWTGLILSSIDRTIEQRRSIAALSAMGVKNGVLRRSVGAQILVPMCIAVVMGFLLFLPVTSLVFAAADEGLFLPVSFVAWLATVLALLAAVTTLVTVPWIKGVATPAALRAE